MQSWRNHLVTAIWMVLAILAGCEPSLESTVEGNITFDEKPLPTGTVTFHPIGGGAAAYGEVKHGEFCVRTGTTSGLTTGEYVVTVVAFETPKKDGSPANQPVPERYGRRHSSGLKCTITEGRNEVHFALNSKPVRR